MARRRLKYKVLLAVVPRLIGGMLKLLRLSMRLDHINKDIIVERAKRGEGTIIAFWHQEFLVGTLIGRDLFKWGVPMYVLASLSEDGELLARTAQRMSIVPTRGSSTRGARSGLKAVARRLREGGCMTLAVDGPKGPRREAKIGAALMAREGGALLVPATVRYGRHWRLKSWDRTMIPKPFSHCAVTYHEPIEVSPGASREELEEARARLERILLEHCQPNPEPESLEGKKNGETG